MQVPLSRGGSGISPGILSLPFLKEIAPGGLSYGSHYVVEYDVDSIWYELSITLAADALKTGAKVDYHTFQHSPGKVRDDLEKLGLNIKKLENDVTFRVMDTYTAATGSFQTPESSEKTGPGGSFWAGSVKVSDWSFGNVHDIRGVVPEEAKKRLHIDDNTSLLLRYNKESEIIDYWRTRVIPWGTTLEQSMIHALVTGVASDSFYKNVESLCEGIFDLKSREEEGKVEHYMRVRIMRGESHDSQWQHLRRLRTGEVTIDQQRRKNEGLGIGAWLKGPKK